VVPDGVQMTITSVLCSRTPLVPIILNVQLPGWVSAATVKVTAFLPRPMVAEGVILPVVALTPDGQSVDESIMVTARPTVPVKLLIAVTVTVVLLLEFGLMGSVLGARLMAKSGVSAGGTTLMVMFRGCVIAPLTADITSGYLPSLAPDGTLMVSVAVVGVAMLGVSAAAGENEDVAPEIASRPDTLRVTSDWKLTSGSILAVIVLEPPLGISTFCGLA